MSDTAAIIYIESFLGTIEVQSENDAIISLYFKKPESGFMQQEIPQILKDAEFQIKEFISGIRRNFDLPLNPKGTEFQLKVWNELLKIPYGETISYIELANRLKNPKAVRAVGTANGSNPISIIIPCHRVIGANGKLIGYGGGLFRKQLLLELEKRDTEPKLF